MISIPQVICASATIKAIFIYLSINSWSNYDGVRTLLGMNLFLEDWCSCMNGRSCNNTAPRHQPLNAIKFIWYIYHISSYSHIEIVNLLHSHHVLNKHVNFISWLRNNDCTVQIKIEYRYLFVCPYILWRSDLQ